jgi:hypothetical protein
MRLLISVVGDAMDGLQASPALDGGGTRPTR